MAFVLIFVLKFNNKFPPLLKGLFYFDSTHFSEFWSAVRSGKTQMVNAITDEQMYHMQAVNLQDGVYSANKIVFRAFGIKPSIDIPIKIIIRKD